MLPLSSRNQPEPEAVSKKPPASADFHPEPLLENHAKADTVSARKRAVRKAAERAKRLGVPLVAVNI